MLNSRSLQELEAPLKERKQAERSWGGILGGSRCTSAFAGSYPQLVSGRERGEPGRERIAL